MTGNPPNRTDSRLPSWRAWARNGLGGFVVLCLAACAGGNGAYPPPSTGANPSASDTTGDVFRKRDTIIIRLTGVPTPDQGIFEVQVDEAGNIPMPHIGNIRAEGQTAVALKESIEGLYKLKQIYTNPTITVLTQEERYVSVTGEVRSPNQVLYRKGLTALGAIAQCGGFTDYSNKRSVIVLRQGQVIRFNAAAALKNQAQDVSLQPDDKIQVDRSIF
jgi:polysaccharide export outer membrane protein